MSAARGKKQEKSVVSGWRRWVYSLIVSAVVCMVVIGLCAALVWRGVLSGTGDGCVVLACILGSAAGGIYLIRGTKGGALPVGIGAGALLAAALFGAGGLLRSDPVAGEGIWPVAAACLCGGALAGVLSALFGHRKKGRAR